MSGVTADFHLAIKLIIQGASVKPVKTLEGFHANSINSSKHSGFVNVPPRSTFSIILRSAHTVYLCVLCGSENKQRLFPYTALTDWFV